MNKVQLYDCCGAQHIFSFPASPTITISVIGYRSDYGSDRIAVSAKTWLEIQLSDKVVDGYVQYRHNNHNYRIPVANPGLTTCVLASWQHRHWDATLRELGFTCVVNNVRNRNSGNRLYFYVRIERPFQGGPKRNRPRWHVDGVPVRGVRLKPDASPYRVRHPVTGLRVFPQPIVRPAEDPDKIRLVV